MAKEKVILPKSSDKPLKRKVTSVPLADLAEGAPPPKIAEVDLYSKIVNLEESEAKIRDAEIDATLFLTTCQEIQALISEISELKSNPTDETANEVKEKQAQVTVKIMKLKKLNRLEKMRTKDSRDALQKYREQVDSDHLHLQNLVYENLHLGKEVKKCYDFKSIDEDMDLVSVEEFYTSAPASISKEEVTKNSAHELKLARLTWELTQRKELAAKLKRLEALKEMVEKDIEMRKEQLASLAPHLKTIIESTKPLQTLLNVPVDKIKKLHELAMLLPKPLYVLYVQAEAYSQLVKWLAVGIVGKEEEAVTREDKYENVASDSSDSEQEEDEEESSRRRKPAKDRQKSGGEESAEARKGKCLKRHALSVELTIGVSGGGSTVTLGFHWLLTLEVVSVTATVSGASTNEASGIAVADLLASSSMLSSMYPGDTGEICPNPSSAFHLQRAGLTEFPAEGVGVPYVWAQTLCGLSFLKGTTATPAPCANISQHSMEATLKVIRDRLRSRIALAKEVKLLESGEALSGKKLQASITSFTAVTLSDLQKVDSGARLIDLNTIDGSYLVYRAAIDVHGVKMAAYILLPPTYPSVRPIFILEVQQKLTALTSVNNDHVRDVEREVNTQISAGVEGATNLLLQQVYSLLLCVEVLTATELNPDRAVKATYFRAVMGRRRSHPYRHMDTAGGIFIHR